MLSLTDDLEFVVHTNQNVLDIRFAAKSTASRADAGCDSITERAESHVVVFQKRGPMWHKHPFDACASPNITPLMISQRQLRTRQYRVQA